MIMMILLLMVDGENYDVTKATNYISLLAIKMSS